MIVMVCIAAKACNFKDDDFHLNDAVEVIALYSLDVAVPHHQSLSWRISSQRWRTY